jgi:hypothetical protein
MHDYSATDLQKTGTMGNLNLNKLYQRTVNRTVRVWLMLSDKGNHFVGTVAKKFFHQMVLG